MDPIKDGENWYAYVENNPVNFVDPLGLKPRPQAAKKHVSKTTIRNQKKAIGNSMNALNSAINLIVGKPTANPPKPAVPKPTVPKVTLPVPSPVRTQSTKRVEKAYQEDTEKVKVMLQTNATRENSPAPQQACEGKWWMLGYDVRYQQMQMDTTPYTVGNYLTSGLYDTINGAVNPQEPFSFEHWINSAETVLVFYDIYGGAVRAGANGIKSGVKSVTTNKGAQEVVKRESGAAGNIIKNKFPNEQMPADGKLLKYTVENGRIKGINGINQVDFVITQDGELIIGSKHHFLGQGQDVLAAGQLKINGQGQIKRIDNLSGHYRPTVSESMNYPELFQDMGFDLNNTWVELYDIEIDSSGLVENVTKSYTKMLGGK